MFFTIIALQLTKITSRVVYLTTAYTLENIKTRVMVIPSHDIHQCFDWIIIWTLMVLKQTEGHFISNDFFAIKTSMDEKEKQKGKFHI